MRGFVALVLVLAAWAAPAGAQVRFDLSFTSALSRSVDPGFVEVILENRVPDLRYDVVVRLEAVPVAAISIEGLGPIGGSQRELSGACEPLAAAITTLRQSTAESHVRDNVVALDALLAEGRCTDTAVVTAARAVRNATQPTVAAVELKAGDRLTVTITRPASEGRVMTWTLVLATEARREVITTFGFSFVGTTDRGAHTVPTPSGTFAIVEDRTEFSLETPVPSVYFSLVGAGRHRRTWTVSPTVGFGLGTDAPTMFVGASLTYETLFSITAGAAATQRRRLLDRYSPGQELTADLDADQLTGTSYGPSWFIAATVRFASNPFKKAPATPAVVATPAPPAGSAARVTPAGSAGPVATTGPGGAQESLRESDVKVRFDARGTLREPGLLATLVERAKSATDVFIVSHGWWNDESAADCFYRRMVGGLAATTPSYLTPDRFRPLFVTVYWPSALFPMEPSDCTRQPLERETTAVFSVARVRAWAAAAFPGAVGASFEADVAGVATLLERERESALSPGEAETLASILTRWRTASDGVGLQGEADEPSIFTGAPHDMVRRWTASPAPPPTELSLPGALSPKTWINFGNAFTFWTMKARAGVVGAAGLSQVLKALQPMRAARGRVHLVGHSFGGKLVTAALGPDARADSLVILQGAFSQFAFATRDEIRAAGISIDRDGAYRGVIANGLVGGPIVVTHSSADSPNRLLYPAGVALVNDVTEAGGAPRYGSLGAQGIRGSSATALDLTTQTLSGLATVPRAVSVDGSRVILGHSDIAKPLVFKLIWDAVETNR